MKKENKRGISLIVLVITIIVMIILATAIILSLSSSGIIGKANKAVTDTNNANKKELAGLLMAEYELGVQTGDIDPAVTSLREYVKEEMENASVDTSDVAITEDGNVLVGLNKVAVKFAEAGVKIGDPVVGYTLSTQETAKSVDTEGIENTAGPNYSEVSAQPAEDIKRDEDISWTYMGIDENGNTLIVGSVTNSSPIINLGGKGGYLNGPDVLDEVCDKMYSSNMGEARSIDINDVIRVLEYTGEKGSYLDSKTMEFVPTKEPLTIGDLVTKKGEPALTSTATPDGTDINKYKADYYKIDKEKDDEEYNTTRQDLIYPEKSLENLSKSYWLASQCVFVEPVYGHAYFDLRCVRVGDNTAASIVSSPDFILFSSYNNSNSGGYALRPIVELDNDVQVSYNGTTITLSK